MKPRHFGDYTSRHSPYTPTITEHDGTDEIRSMRLQFSQLAAHHVLAILAILAHCTQLRVASQYTYTYFLGTTMHDVRVFQFKTQLYDARRSVHDPVKHRVRGPLLSATRTNHLHLDHKCASRRSSTDDGNTALAGKRPITALGCDSTTSLVAPAVTRCEATLSNRSQNSEIQAVLSARARARSQTPVESEDHSACRSA